MSVKASSTVNTAPHLLRLGVYRGGDAMHVPLNSKCDITVSLEPRLLYRKHQKQDKKISLPIFNLYDHLVEMGKKCRMFDFGVYRTKDFQKGTHLPMT